jgi:hypothetical protein
MISSDHIAVLRAMAGWPALNPGQRAACKAAVEALAVETKPTAPETGALQEFVKGLSRQHCSHGGDKNAPAWPCIPCAARTVLGDENTPKAGEQA